MGKILLKKHIPTSSQEDNLPLFEDEWARQQLLRHTHELDQHRAEIRDIKAILSEQLKNVKTEWKNQISQQSIFVSRSVDVPINIKSTFQKLEEDFSDFSNRIVWCNELKNCLSKFEEELEEYDAKYLSWFVATLKDVFSYNYAETITEEQLDLLKNGIETIYEKQETCDIGSFAEYHLQLVESGLSLLPTTQKAIDEFGE
jgi:hypothetical protein